MNRRLVVRIALACLALCLVAWRLPPMLDQAFASIEQHKGTVSMLTADGVTMPGELDARARPPEGPGLEVFAASGASLTPEQKARLLEAARRHDPLAQLKARERTASRPASPAAPPATPPQPAPPAQRSVEDVLRELGIDPASMDPKSLDVDALLKKARDGALAPRPKP